MSLVASTDEQQLRSKIAIALMGAIIGAGTYQIGKIISKQRSEQAKQEDKKREQEIKSQIKRHITGIQDDFLEKHSQRLMELVAQRQE